MGRRRSKDEGAGRRKRRPRVPADPTPEHGAHTLRLWRGTVVGCDGPDIFVELGPRMQGVLRADSLDGPVSPGDILDVSLRGREQGLWILSPAASLPLASWEHSQIGDLVEARLLSTNRGGFDGVVGRLHGFLPFSESGLGRREDPESLIGRALPCEVVDVDTARQRVTLSHRRYLARLDEARVAAGARLRQGEVVRGRICEIVGFGAFVDLARGVRGLLHRSNISYERVTDPSQHLSVGQSMELVVLSIRDGGRRVGLGLKQRFPSPWRGLTHRARSGDLMRGRVVEVARFGLFVRVSAGVVGLAHVSELGLSPQARTDQAAALDEEVVVRIVAVDAAHERLALSFMRADGSSIEPAELMDEEDREHLEVAPAQREDGIGRLLHAALRRRG